MIYIKALFVFLKILLNIHKYKNFSEKPDGLGRKWTLYKRPIFGRRLNEKKKNIPETKSHHFIYHAFESLEAKSSKDFKKEMLDNLVLGTIWYALIEDNIINTKTDNE